MKEVRDDVKAPKELEAKEAEAVVKKKHQTRYWETLIHLFKAGVGPGCFAMAEAMSNCGLILGTCITVCLSIICLYEQHVLLQCANNVRRHYHLDERPDYAKTFELSLLANDKWKRHSRVMRRVVNVFLILTQLGFCSVYVLFIGNNMKNVLAFYGYDFNVRIVILFSLLPILLPALITNLKYLGE